RRTAPGARRPGARSYRRAAPCCPPVPLRALSPGPRGDRGFRRRPASRREKGRRSTAHRGGGEERGSVRGARCTAPSSCRPTAPLGTRASPPSMELERNNVFYNIARGWAIQCYPDLLSQIYIVNNTFDIEEDVVADDDVVAARQIDPVVVVLPVGVAGVAAVLPGRVPADIVDQVLLDHDVVIDEGHGGESDAARLAVPPDIVNVIPREPEIAH